MGFTNDLRALISEQGMTQKGIAERVGVSQTMISRYLRGAIPAQPVRVRFYHAFGLTTTEEERTASETEGSAFLTVEQAAKLLHVSTECVKAGLRQEQLPIGCAVSMKEWKYIIPKKQFTFFTGIKFEE